MFRVLSIIRGCCLLFALAACSETEPKRDPAVITLDLPFGYSDSRGEIFPLHQLYLDAAEKFSETHPDITVEIVQVEEADIIPFRSYHLQEEELPFLDLNQLQQGEIDISTELLEVGMVDGKQMMLPYAANPYAIFYNKRLMERATLPDIEAGWTWEQFAEVSNQLEPAQRPVLSYDLPTLDLLMGSTAKGGILSPSGKAAGYLDSVEAVEVVQWLNEYFDHDSIAVVDGRKHFSDFTQSLSGLMLNGHFAFAPIQEFMLEPQQLGVAPLPYFEGGARANPIAIEGMGISKGSKHPEVAWAFMKYLFLENHEHTQGFADYYLLTSPSLAKAAGQSEDELKKTFYNELPYQVWSFV